MRINANMAAIRGYNNLNKVNQMKERSLVRLSTGKRINSAADDASGMSISVKMQNQIKGMEVASRNLNDASSLASTTESALGEISNVLSRIRELCVQGSSDLYSPEDRQKIGAEITELTAQINYIADNTEFNGIKLLDDNAKDLSIQIGANKDQKLTIKGFKAKDVVKDFGANIKVDSSANAENSLEKIDEAIEAISAQRSTLGATLNRIDFSASNLTSMKTNLTEAESRISDCDLAQEMVQYSKANILSQSGNQMLSVGLQMTNSVLQLLG